MSIANQAAKPYTKQNTSSDARCSIQHSGNIRVSYFPTLRAAYIIRINYYPTLRAGTVLLHTNSYRMKPMDENTHTH